MERLLRGRAEWPSEKGQRPRDRGGGQRPARAGDRRQGERGTGRGTGSLGDRGTEDRGRGTRRETEGSRRADRGAQGPGQDRGAASREDRLVAGGGLGPCPCRDPGPVRGWGGCGTVAGPAPPPRSRLRLRPLAAAVPGGPAAPRALFDTLRPRDRPAVTAARPAPPRPAGRPGPRPYLAPRRHSGSSGHWKRGPAHGAAAAAAAAARSRPGTCTARAARPPRAPPAAGAGLRRGGASFEDRGGSIAREEPQATGERAPPRGCGSRRRGCARRLRGYSRGGGEQERVPGGPRPDSAGAG